MLKREAVFFLVVHLAEEIAGDSYEKDGPQTQSGSKPVDGGGGVVGNEDAGGKGENGNGCEWNACHRDPLGDGGMCD